MTPRPIPEAPPGNRHHVRSGRYVARREVAVFTARCVCGSGSDATWIQFMDDPAACECTCAAVPAGVA